MTQTRKDRLKLRSEAKWCGDEVFNAISKSLLAQQRADSLDDEFAKDYWTAYADKCQDDAVFYARKAGIAYGISKIQKVF